MYNIDSSTTPHNSQSGPWEITFGDLTTDFTSTSDKELTLTYSIGKARQYNAPTLLQEDCESAITDATITQATPVRTPDDASYDTLTLEYDFNKATIGGSSVYDASTGELKVCQVLQLVEQGMVIAEDKHLATITFDLGVDFEIAGQDLAAAAAASAVAGAAGVQSYVKAYKCGAGVMTGNTNALVPNEDLYVCVHSTSADVEIASLDEMDIDGFGAAGTAATLSVINAGTITYAAFTSAEAVSNTERRVKTRVPASVFGYTPGASITITGSATMKFASSGRELAVMVDTTLFEGSSNEDPANAKFELNVGLQPAAVKINKINSSTTSVASVGVKGSIVIGLVIAFVIGLVIAFVIAIYANANGGILCLLRGT